MVANQLLALPIGLVIGKSVNVVRSGGMLSGCATTHDILSQNFFASDFWCGPGQSPMAFSAHYGPFASEVAARGMLNGVDLADLDASGTVGVSAWLVLP